MPQLTQIPAATDTFRLPVSGVTVVMRRFATGRDKIEAWQGCQQDGFHPRQNHARFVCHVAALLAVSWDATRKNEAGELEPIPISADTIGAIDDETDYLEIVGQAAKRLTLREDDPAKEGPFETPSTPSSPDTN